MNIMTIGAHPDDAEFCCGGTLTHCAQRGDRVVICVMTDGRSHPLGDPEQITRLRREEAGAAASILGAELMWLGIHDGELMEDLPTRRKLVDAIGAAAPDLILTHPPEDYHADHVATSRLVMGAVQSAYVKFEHMRHPLPVAFMPSALGIGFLPDEYVDVSAAWETRTRALLQHRTQYLSGPDYGPEAVREPLDQYYIPHAARVMCEFWGLTCGKRYAEAFRWWRAADRIVTRRLLP